MDLICGKSHPEESEYDIICRKIKIKSLSKLVERGKIKDGPTITALKFLEYFLQKYNNV